MSADNLTVLRRGLPASLTPELVDRLIARASACPDAERVTTRAPYTQAPIADLPMATPHDVMAARRSPPTTGRWSAAPSSPTS